MCEEILNEATDSYIQILIYWFILFKNPQIISLYWHNYQRTVHNTIKKTNSTFFMMIHFICYAIEVSWKLNIVSFVSNSSTELVHLTDEMEDIFKRFSRDKKTGKLSYNEEQIHKMEK